MTSTASGIDIPAWGGRRATAALEKVKHAGRKSHAPCCLCGQRIDYSLPSTHPDGCTVQHTKSRKMFPELTWDERFWAPAHLSCNQSAGDGTRGGIDLGVNTI